MSRGPKSIVLIVLAACVIAIFVAGCGGSGKSSSDAAPTTITPSLILRTMPAGYEPTKLMRARLTGNPVPDAILISSNGEGALFPHDDLQVLSWNASAKSWRIAFDAQKTPARVGSLSPRQSSDGPGYAGLTPPLGTLLDPTSKRAETINELHSVHLLGSKGTQLAFSLGNVMFGPSASLFVVDLQTAKPKVLYTWSGVGLTTWRLSGARIDATADYYVTGDASCCPARTYSFVVGAQAGRITELSDDRPFLGTIAQQSALGPRVVRVLPHSPAAGHLHVGDVLVGIAEGASRYHGTVYDRLAFFKAGQTARLEVQRGAARLVVPVELASLNSSAAATAATPAARPGGYPYVSL